MKCYYHNETDSIAICKSCSRALCKKCAVDVHPGTACKSRCEEEVAELNGVIERSKTAYQKTGKAYRNNAIGMLIMGIIFIVIGVLPYVLQGKVSGLFMSVLGIVFILWSFFSYKNAKQIESIK